MGDAYPVASSGCVPAPTACRLVPGLGACKIDPAFLRIRGQQCDPHRIPGLQSARPAHEPPLGRRLLEMQVGRLLVHATDHGVEGFADALEKVPSLRLLPRDTIGFLPRNARRDLEVDKAENGIRPDERDADAL